MSTSLNESLIKHKWTTDISISGVMVSIGASQALDPGSIPGWRKFFFWNKWNIQRYRFHPVRGFQIFEYCREVCEKKGKKRKINDNFFLQKFDIFSVEFFFFLTKYTLSNARGET